MTATPQAFLVGAGPGDPGLLTLKGKDALQKADVLIYDRLVAPRLLDYAREDCELLYVGKDPSKPAVSQEEINDLIVQKALGGNVVVRLKGGDPFVFGRGGEEAEALRAHHVEFDIVPGVTSAIAAPAYAGIPVTDRRFASTFTVITGHERAGKSVSSIPWKQIAGMQGTLVFLMGMENLSPIVRNLIDQGMDGETPAAVVQYGTWPAQRSIGATLSTIEEEVFDQGIENPAVIVVGRVAALREQLQWFENKPLIGKTVVVTRARHQASTLAAQLEGHGARVLECPVIEIAPPSDPMLLEQAIGRISEYRWVVFTSANGVDAFFAAAEEQGKDARCLANADVVAMGAGTQAALARNGIKQVLTPGEARSEGIVELLADKLKPKERVLIARAEKARDVLPRLLREQGGDVDDVPAYRTHIAEGCREAILAALWKREVDAVTFTSSSTVQNLVACLEGRVSLLEGIALYSIGPITSAALRQAGLKPCDEAKRYTVDGLVDSIVSSQGRMHESA